MVPRRATKIVDLSYDVVIEGKSLHAYRLEFHDLDFVLAKGKQYWVSLNVKDTFSIQERAYFCSNYYCDGRCPIRWNPGHVIGTPNGSASEWVSVNHDFSFLLAGEDAAVGGVDVDVLGAATFAAHPAAA